MSKNFDEIINIILNDAEAKSTVKPIINDNAFNTLAVTTKKIFDSFIKAGFTENQALSIISIIIKSGMNPK